MNAIRRLVGLSVLVSVSLDTGCNVKKEPAPEKTTQPVPVVSVETSTPPPATPPIVTQPAVPARPATLLPLRALDQDMLCESYGVFSASEGVLRAKGPGNIWTEAISYDLSDPTRKLIITLHAKLQRASRGEKRPGAELVIGLSKDMPSWSSPTKSLLMARIGCDPNDSLFARLAFSKTGTWTLLEENTFSVAPDQWHTVRVELDQRELAVVVDEKPVIRSFVPGSAFALKGHIGIISIRDSLLEIDRMQIAYGSASLQSPVANRLLLENRSFSFAAKHGPPFFIGQLHPNGLVVGHTHPNETYWDINPAGHLVFMSKDGYVTTVFDRMAISNGLMYFEGAFQLSPGVIHVLQEVPGKRSLAAEERMAALQGGSSPANEPSSADMPSPFEHLEEQPLRPPPDTGLSTARTLKVTIALPSLQGDRGIYRDLRNILINHGRPACDLSGDPDLILYMGITYLMPLGEAAKVLQKRVSSRSIVHTEGFPPDCFFYYKFDGLYDGRFNKLLLVTDSQSQVVAVQLVEETPRGCCWLKGHSTEWKLHNIVQCRRKAQPDWLIAYQTARRGNVLCIDSELIDCGSDGEAHHEYSASRGYGSGCRSVECARLYIPQPMIDLILYSIEKVLPLSVGN